MLAHVADEVEKAEVLEPVVVVDHPGRCGTLKVEEALKLGLLAGEVVLQDLDVEELALGRLAAGVAHHAGGAPDEGDGTVPGPL